MQIPNIRETRVFDAVTTLLWKMEKSMAVVLFFSLVFVLPTQATSLDFKFFIVRSADFQNPGRLVKYTLTMTVPESTPLKTKVKMPFNNTAILRLTNIEVTSVDPHLQVSGSTTPAMTSTASDDINDIALIDFGNVTRQSSVNDTNIVIEFEAQVLLHSHIVHGGKQWVSVGSEYKNSSVWAAQLAVKTVNPVSARPDLDVEFSVISDNKNPYFGDKVTFKVKVSHSPKTSAEAESGVVEWVKPDFLTYDSNAVASGSITQVESAAHYVRFKFGKLGFSDTLDFTIVAKLDPSKSKADGKIHHLSSYVNLSYNGPAGSACASSSGSREYAVQKPVTNHFLFYAPPTDCDSAVGMEDGRIQDGQITASSYNPTGPPSDARLQKQGCWITAQRYWKEKNQYLQVNFTTKMKIRRIAVQGCDLNKTANFYVKTLSVYYSDDGAIWTPYKESSQTKVFKANTNNKEIHLVIFPIPIEAKIIRIRPRNIESQINLRLEIYGCESSQQPKSPTLKYASRGYMLDKKSDIMYACSIPMERRKVASTCFFSADKGLTWKAIDYRLVYILGYDSETKRLYGVASNLKTIMKSTQDHADKFTMVPESDWDLVRSKSTMMFPTMLDASDMTVLNDTSSVIPPAEHHVSADVGTKWGVSAFGIHVEDSSVWKQRMSWMIDEY